MSTLSDYRASIKRLLEADDTGKAFQDEGFDERVVELISKSKSFSAVRDVLASSRAAAKRQQNNS